MTTILQRDSQQTTAHGAGHRGAVRSHNQPVPVPPTAPREGRIGGMVHLHQRASTTAHARPHAAAAPNAVATNSRRVPAAPIHSAQPHRHHHTTIPAPPTETTTGLVGTAVDLLDGVSDARGATSGGETPTPSSVDGAAGQKGNLAKLGEDRNGEARNHTWPVPVLPTAPRRGRIGGMVDRRQGATTTISTRPFATAELSTAHGRRRHEVGHGEPA